MEEPSAEQNFIKKLKYDTCLVTPVSSGSSLQSVSSEVLAQCGKPLSRRVRRIRQLEELQTLQATSTKDIDPAKKAEEAEWLAEEKRIETELLAEDIRAYKEQLNAPSATKCSIL